MARAAEACRAPQVRFEDEGGMVYGSWGGPRPSLAGYVTLTGRREPACSSGAAGAPTKQMGPSRRPASMLWHGARGDGFAPRRAGQFATIARWV
jgi:hypothetical protein